MSTALKPGEKFGNVTVGEHPTWLPTFGAFPPLKPDTKKYGVPGIDGVESVRAHLQLALLVELSTIPVYLYAAYGTDEAKDTLGTSEVIKSVVIEEMLHLTLVGNCLKAIGGTPSLYPRKGVLEHWPAYPMDMAGHRDGLRLTLRKPDLRQLTTFLRIELPEEAGAEPEEENYDTLGQFYEAVMQAIKALLPTDPNLFDSLSQDYQFTNEEVYHGKNTWDQVVVIQDQASADRALQIIVDQGEGAPGTEFDRNELAHFYKFMSLFKPPFPAALPLPDNPRTASYKDENIKALSYLFDASYCFFLLSLERMWTLSRKDNLDARKAIFKNFAIMGKVLKPIGQYLVTQTDPAYPGKRAAPTFNYFGFRDNEPLKEVLANVNIVEAKYGANLPDALKGAFVALRNCTEVYLDGR